MKINRLDYARLVEHALRGVVRTVLTDVAENGLSGEHHVYLTFRTDHPEVLLPARLRPRHPKEMTIVLQHQFSELKVAEERFSVVLHFDGRPERLTVPFEALTAFVDPGASFGLQFNPSSSAADGPSSTLQSAPENTVEDVSSPSVAHDKVIDVASFRKVRE